MDRARTAGTLAVVFVVAFALYWAGAAPREVTKTDEHRYLAVAREFVAGGNWLYCRLNGEEYTHKPPIFFWTAAWFRLLGCSWTAAAKLPSVLGAAVATTLLFDLARRLYGRTAAWTAALALVVTREYYALACRGNLDALLSAFTTLATYAFARATLCGAGDRGRTRWTAIAFAAAGLGILEKGPAAIAIPGSAALVALLWDDRWAKTPWWRWVLGIVILVVPPSDYGLVAPDGAAPVVRGLATAGILVLRLGTFALVSGMWRSRWSALATWRWALAPIALLVPFAWAAASTTQAPSGWGYVHALAIGQGVGHADGQVDKLEPWWFYAKTFPTGLLPWTLILPAAVWAWVRHRSPDRVAADRFTMAWVVAPLVVMSISKAKRDLYLVPIFPATALLVGRLAMVVETDAGRFGHVVVRRTRLVSAWIALVAGGIAIAVGVLRLAGADALVATRWRQWQDARDLLPAYIPWTFIATGALLMAAAVALLRARDFAAAARATALVAVALVCVDASLYSPIGDALGAPREFLERVKARIGDAYLGDYGGSDWAPQWVCDRTVVPFVETRREAEKVLAQRKGPVYFLVDRERYAEKGLPDGARLLMEEVRPVESALMLIGRE